MSLTFQSIQEVLITIENESVLCKSIPDFYKVKQSKYKLIDAMKIVLNTCITIYNLPIIDDIKAMFIKGSTNVSTVAIIELIRANYYDNKDISPNKYIERDIIIDLHKELSKLTSIGRNQLIITLTKCTTKHVNITASNLISVWK